jgi:hypothetical protein
MDFPHFNGIDARIWLDKCASYFAMFQIPITFKVSTASIHMSGSAAHWFQTFKHSARAYLWEVFATAVVKEFELDTHRAKTMQLLQLRQSGSVEDYRRSFEQLVYHISLFDNSIIETMLIVQFLLGLKEEIRMQVKLMLPNSVAKAATLTLCNTNFLQK